MIIVLALFSFTALAISVAIAVFGGGARVRSSGKSCSSCGALDPVMSPVYNMMQIVKQSILLEEHINQERKRCSDCITKHFLHMIGLAEEAVSLDPETPSYRTVAARYSEIFDAWRLDHEDVEVPKSLRAERKKLMAHYYSSG